MQFREWLDLQEGSRTGAKLGLYPPLSDALGQYPPLYTSPKAADFITYVDMEWDKEGISTKNGVVIYSKHRQSRGLPSHPSMPRNGYIRSLNPDSA